MRAFPFQKICLLVLVLALSACAPAATALPPTQTPAVPPMDLPKPTLTPTLTGTPPPPAPTPTPTPRPLSFNPAAYQDETAGFKLDYPAGWTLIPKAVIGSRASQAQISSPGSSAETLAPGGTRLSITIYQWDPKKDLAAYVTHRLTALDASGSTLLSQAGLDLPDGRKAMSFVVQGPDKSQAYVLFTTLGEEYLEISGEGNLPLVDEIARTMRPLS